MIEHEGTRECPFCLSPINEGGDCVPCPKCGVEHHAECWERNGKCSVHGCDGWARWSGAIARKMAPKLGGAADLSSFDGTEVAQVAAPAPVAQTATRQSSSTERCIKCGTPVDAEALLCGTCRRTPGHFWENCSGPTVLFLGGTVGIITLIVRALA